MINIYVIPPTRREPDYDHPDGTLHLPYGGIYFFLCPYLLEVRDHTGQMIDPQCHADFPKEQLPVVLDKLQNARKSAELSPTHFSVHVGKQFTPVAKELYEDVSRSELLTVIDRLITLFQDAAAKGCRLILAEE
jgi:hypothetical protein